MFYELYRKWHKDKQVGKNKVITISKDDKFTKLDDFIMEIKYRTVYPVRDAYYWLRNLLIIRRHIIKTGLPVGRWYDSDGRMLYGMMNLLVEFIEGEEPFKWVDWKSDKYHSHAAKEMKAIYKWWKNYPKREKQIDDALTKWHDLKFRKNGKKDIDWLAEINKADSPEVKVASDYLRKLEGKLHKEEQEMLIRLVNIRDYLWV